MFRIAGLFGYMFLLAACSNSKQNAGTNARQNPSSTMINTSFDKEGHRGCRGLMPENTIPAMLHAIGLGATTLELDVVISKDKKVVISHEAYFNSEITTKADGSFIDKKDEKHYNIYQMNYEEVKLYDVGMKPHARFPQQQKLKAVKPLLSDLFEAVTEYMTTRRRPFPFYNIEIKSEPATDGIYQPAPAEFVELLMAVIKQYQKESEVIIQSFDFRPLQYLHEHYPDIKIAMLIAGDDKRSLDEQLRSLGFKPETYSPAHELVTPELVAACHNKGIKIIPWTVNDKATIDKLKQMGVDGIITDYPDLF